MRVATRPWHDAVVTRCYVTGRWVPALSANMGGAVEASMDVLELQSPMRPAVGGISPPTRTRVRLRACTRVSLHRRTGV